MGTVPSGQTSVALLGMVQEIAVLTQTIFKTNDAIFIFYSLEAALRLIVNKY